ncbi:MAG: tetratricopeptide repeat protein [Sulfuricellaceae bacterium]
MAEPTTAYQHHPDLKRLLKAVQRAGDEFALFFVECNLPSLRNELAGVLAADMTPPPVRVELSTPSGEAQQLDELIAAQIQDTDQALPPGAVFLFGLEQWLPTLSSERLRSTVQQLNWRRNRFARLHRPLVIWLPRYALDLLAEHTPDFYDWYSGVFVFQASAEQQAQEERNSLRTIWSENGIHAANRLSQAEKQRWLHTLRELLQEHTENDAGRAGLLNDLAYLMKSLGDYPQALGYYQQSLAIYREIGDRKNEGAVLNNISQIHQARGDYATALGYLEQSLAIFREIGDKSGEGTTLNNISQIYDARGDYASALGYLEQSLAIFREIGDKSGEGRALNNISQIHQARGDTTTALGYLEQSLAIRREIGDKSGEGITLSNISQIHKARGDYATALGYLEQSLAIQQQIGDKKGEGTTLNNISQIHKARGDSATALGYLERSLAIQQQIGDTAGQCATLFNIASIHWQNAEQDEAMRLWGKVYRIAKQINLAQALDALKKLAEQLGLPGGLEGWEAGAQQADGGGIKAIVAPRA